MVPTSADTGKAKRELKDDACQCFHPQRVSASYCISRSPPSLASQSPLHMVQAPFKLPHLCEVSGQVSQCMSPLRAVSPFSTALWT